MTAYDQRKEEDNDEVYNQGRSNPDDRDNLVDNLVALGSEEDKNGIEQADQRPWCNPLQEGLVVPRRACQLAHSKPCDDGRTQRNA